MYAVIHRYEIGDGPLDAVIQAVGKNFADRVPEEIGSLLYTAVDTGDGTATTILLYPDKGAAERGAVASARVRESLNAQFGIAEKERIQGEVLLSRANAEVVQRVDPR
jgi:hypothetical protein